MHTATTRRVGVTFLLAALFAVVMATAASADEPVAAGEQATTTTILAEGPTEITVPDEQVLGPDSPELPDTGAGHLLALVVAGVALVAAGGASSVLAVRRVRSASSSF